MIIHIEYLYFTKQTMSRYQPERNLASMTAEPRAAKLPPAVTALEHQPRTVAAGQVRYARQGGCSRRQYFVLLRLPALVLCSLGGDLRQL